MATKSTWSRRNQCPYKADLPSTVWLRVHVQLPGKRPTHESTALEVSGIIHSHDLSTTTQLAVCTD